MDIGRPDTTTEAQELIGMVQYYRDMWPRRSRILAPLTEAASGPKGRKILWNDRLEISFKEMNLMVSAETLISYLDCKLPFTVHTDASDKHLGAFISHNNKPIAFFSRFVPAQDVHFFYTRSHLSTLQNYALHFSTNFHFTFIFKNALHNLVIKLCSALKIFQKYSTVIY